MGYIKSIYKSMWFNWSFFIIVIIIMISSIFIPIFKFDIIRQKFFEDPQDDQNGLLSLINDLNKNYTNSEKYPNYLQDFDKITIMEQPKEIDYIFVEFIIEAGCKGNSKNLAEAETCYQIEWVKTNYPDNEKLYPDDSKWIRYSIKENNNITYKGEPSSTSFADRLNELFQKQLQKGVEKLQDNEGKNAFEWIQKLYLNAMDSVEESIYANMFIDERLFKIVVNRDKSSNKVIFKIFRNKDYELFSKKQADWNDIEEKYGQLFPRIFDQDNSGNKKINEEILSKLNTTFIEKNLNFFNSVNNNILNLKQEIGKENNLNKVITKKYTLGLVVLVSLVWVSVFSCLVGIVFILQRIFCDKQEESADKTKPDDHDGSPVEKPNEKINEQLLMNFSEVLSNQLWEWTDISYYFDNFYRSDEIDKFDRCILFIYWLYAKKIKNYDNVEPSRKILSEIKQVFGVITGARYLFERVKSIEDIPGIYKFINQKLGDTEFKILEEMITNLKSGLEKITNNELSHGRSYTINSEAAIYFSEFMDNQKKIMGSIEEIVKITAYFIKDPLNKQRLDAAKSTFSSMTITISKHEYESIQGVIRIFSEYYDIQKSRFGKTNEEIETIPKQTEFVLDKYFEIVEPKLEQLEKSILNKIESSIKFKLMSITNINEFSKSLMSVLNVPQTSNDYLAVSDKIKNYLMNVKKELSTIVDSFKIESIRKMFIETLNEAKDNLPFGDDINIIKKHLENIHTKVNKFEIIEMNDLEEIIQKNLAQNQQNISESIQGVKTLLDSTISKVEKSSLDKTILNTFYTLNLYKLNEEINKEDINFDKITNIEKSPFLTFISNKDDWGRKVNESYSMLHSLDDPASHFCQSILKMVNLNDLYNIIFKSDKLKKLTLASLSGDSDKFEEAWVHSGTNTSLRIVPTLIFLLNNMLCPLVQENLYHPIFQLKNMYSMIDNIIRLLAESCGIYLHNIPGMATTQQCQNYIELDNRVTYIISGAINESEENQATFKKWADTYLSAADIKEKNIIISISDNGWDFRGKLKRKTRVTSFKEISSIISNRP